MKYYSLEQMADLVFWAWDSDTSFNLSVNTESVTIKTIVNESMGFNVTYTYITKF